MSFEKLIQEIEKEFPSERNNPPWQIVISLRDHLNKFERQYGFESAELERNYQQLMNDAPNSHVRADYTEWYFVCREMSAQLDTPTRKDRPLHQNHDVDYERPANAGLAASVNETGCGTWINQCAAAKTPLPTRAQFQGR
jgi:hypothetical protein